VAGGLLAFSVLLEPIREARFRGYYYAHIPALDLTTHGKGVEAALKAATELVEAWVAEKRAHREPVPVETGSFVTQIEVHDAVHRT